MNIASKTPFVLHRRHLLGMEGLSPDEITGLLDLAEEFVELNRQIEKKRAALRGRTLINLFFEASTRTQSSFELAGKRLGADVMNMLVASSSMKKGETLIDTAMTLNAMHPDILVMRHHASGAVELLARKVDGSVINAGDGAHEHPTQALLDALTIRRNKGQLEGLVVAICGDVMHSRVARSNILLALMGGPALTAGELAWHAAVSAQTTSGHLSKLADAKLVALEKQGRHRYYRLASPEIAQAMEALMAVAATGPKRHRPIGPRDEPDQVALEPPHQRARGAWRRLLDQLSFVQPLDPGV